MEPHVMEARIRQLEDEVKRHKELIAELEIKLEKRQEFIETDCTCEPTDAGCLCGGK